MPPLEMVIAAKPKVSVIVPNYNHARFLPQRVNSVLGQTFQDFDLILLDDCSTDNSRSILAGYADPRVRMEFNKVNSGSSYKQWNKGVSLARGEYVWIAESDDYADEHLLERLVSVLDSDPKVMFAYCRSWRVTEDDEKIRFGDSDFDYLDPQRWAADFRADGAEECRKYFVYCNPVQNASAVLFRRASYELVGGPDETMRLCGDWKLWAAMALGGRIAYLSQPLNYYRSHGASVRNKSLQARLDVTETLEVIGWILGQVTLADAAREKMCQRHAEFWVPALLSTLVPLGQKYAILRSARVFDRHAIRRVVGPSFDALRRKILKHCRFVLPGGCGWFV